jgi:hypothetical protein
MSRDAFADLRVGPLPEVPRLWAALGPGIVWMALAQGSAEIYFWPYFVAKYGALYLCLLVPACFLQMPINLEIGRYTVLTGESVFVGFTRLGKGFGLFMWAFFAVNFVHLPRRFPAWTRPGALQEVLFLVVMLFYVVASMYYLWVRIRLATGAES